MFILAQIVGVFGVATFLLSYQLKRRKHIVLLNGISSVLYVLQYILLGAFEGAAIDVVSTISTFSAHSKHKGFVAKHLKTVIIAVNLLFVIVGICLYKNIFSLFPIVGAMFQNIALWIDDERRIRLVSLVGAPLWLIYNFISRAYGSTVGSVLVIVSLVIAIIRYDVLPLRKTNK